jgi:hypothetical protein
MRKSAWRSAGYWILVICSAWLLLAGLFFWTEVGGRPLGIVQAAPFGVPAWHLLVPLFGLVSLLLLLAQPSGTFWVLLYLAVPVLMATPVVLNNLQGHMIIALPTTLVAPLLLIYLAVVLFMAVGEAVPLHSPLVRLVYFGRVRHLRELYLLARVHGWGVKGPEQPEHAVTVSGKWRARRVMIQSGARYIGPPATNGYFLRVAVETQRRPWPMFLGVGTAQPRPRALVHARVARCDSAAGQPADIYFWPPDGAANAETPVQPVQDAIQSGCAFLRERTVVRSLDNGILFFHASGLHRTENAEQVERLVAWLVSLAEVMEGPDFSQEFNARTLKQMERM